MRRFHAEATPNTAPAAPDQVGPALQRADLGPVPLPDDHEPGPIDPLDLDAERLQHHRQHWPSLAADEQRERERVPVDDQYLSAADISVERQLLVALVTGRADLDDQLRPSLDAARGHI